MRPQTLETRGKSRRNFLVGAGLAGAGLVIAFHVPVGPVGRALAASPDTVVNPINAYLTIAPDSTVTVLSAHMEGGQGIYSGIATLVAEELDADWDQMHVEGAAGNPALYGNVTWGGAIQGTGGSSAIPSSWDRYRRAGATARAMLVEAAARDWGVPASEIMIAKGTVAHASGREATFGDLAEKAAEVPPPASVELKDPKDWVFIGNENLRRLDSVPKTTGQPLFTIDVRLPGMLTAVIARPPLFGATLKSFDATEVKKMPGVVDVVRIPDGIAVVGRDFWSASQGREALSVEWDESNAETRGTDTLMAEYKALAKDGKAAIARRDGDAPAALASASDVIEAEFEFPYLAHAPMEPINAIARMKDGMLEVWGGHQLPDVHQQTAATIAGVPMEKVKLHLMMTGGFFGRRATPNADVIAEAVQVVKAMGTDAPVHVQWTREDDIRGGRYRPLYYHTLKATLDDTGMPSAWHHRIVGQSIVRGTPFEGGLVRNGIDKTSVEGAENLPYAIPNLEVDLITTDVKVPVLWWRAVGSTHTAYSTEIFIDQLAEAAGKDPVEYRRALLAGKARHLGVLNLAAEKAGWGSPLPDGKARGVSVHKSFGTYVAQVAEVAVQDGEVKVERIVCAVDCGIAVNPDVIRAQIEGGIGYGLCAALHGKVTLTDGAVEESNFHDYVCLRIEEMPKVEVYIVPSTESPMGVGEPGVPPAAPAVANAIFAATGRKLHSLPFAGQDMAQG